MTLVKRNQVRRPSIWNEFFDDNWLGTPSVAQAGTQVPAVNIKDTDKGFEVEMAAPGKKKEDFSINVENDLMTISSEQSMNKEENGEEGTYTRREFSYSSFRRSFTLPDSANADDIKASYTDGVLHISIPKKEEAKPKAARMIEIA